MAGVFPRSNNRSLHGQLPNTGSQQTPIGQSEASELLFMVSQRGQRVGPAPVNIVPFGTSVLSQNLIWNSQLQLLRSMEYGYIEYGVDMYAFVYVSQ